MSDFQQGMILKHINMDKHYVFIQDIPDISEKDCIVYNLETDKYMVTDSSFYERIADDCPTVNVLHSKVLMNEAYTTYIRNASQGAGLIAEQALKHFEQLMGANLLLTDDSTFIVKGVHLINGVLTIDWMGRIQFNGIRCYKGREKLQSSTLAHLRPNSILLDALCKSIEESDQ